MEIKLKTKRASKLQLEYIEILFNDLGFSITQRKDYLMLRYKKSHMDMLFMYEAGEVIRDLKILKDKE